MFKPFVYLAAFEQAAAEGRTDVTPASITLDEPETFEFDDQVWTPENYEKTYDGPITFRHALAHSRNLATIHVAQAAGYDHVASLWKKLGIGTTPKAYPSIALGVFEATPYEIATAYTIFPNYGVMRPLRNILSITSGGAAVTRRAPEVVRQIARRDTSYLVTNMMRSVLNEGTAAGARSAGFTLDAAGKTGTTNDLRDAWFVGFTPELLTVVWVGFDDNQPVGLSGAQAALPIWTEFMTRALAGRRRRQVRRARRHLVRGHRRGHRPARRARPVPRCSTRRSSPAPSPRNRVSCIGRSKRRGRQGRQGRHRQGGQAAGTCVQS